MAFIKHSYLRIALLLGVLALQIPNLALAEDIECRVSMNYRYKGTVVTSRATYRAPRLQKYEQIGSCMVTDLVYGALDALDSQYFCKENMVNREGPLVITDRFGATRVTMDISSPTECDEGGY